MSISPSRDNENSPFYPAVLSTAAKVWERLIAAGSDDAAVSNMTIVPTLLGERYAPDLTASVTGITLDTLHLGSIFRALCSGIIKNLHE